MNSKRFIRTIEDFECENCSYEVAGNGYTNHCPKCLYSKHVDINPGDRASNCQGLMVPIGSKTKAGKLIVEHKCMVCKFGRSNKLSEEDDLDALLRLDEVI